MRRFAVVLIALVVTCTLPFRALASDPGPVADIVHIDNERMTALLKGDIEILRRIFSDDLVYVHASGRVDSKADYLARLSNGSLRYLALRYDGPPKVRMFGRDAAVVTGKVVLTSQGTTGSPNDRTLTTTGVYARESGAWKLVSYQSSIITQ